MYRVAVVGAGQWAQNGLRVISESHQCELRVVCDLDPGRLAAVARRHPGTSLVTDPALALADPHVDVVYVATPPHTHAPLVRRALLAGKHVLVEKPFTTDAGDAAELVALAEERRLTLMVGHTFLYSAPVLKIRELITAGTIGELCYVDSQRVNLGRYQDSGVLWDLAPHDLSILMYWLGERPAGVRATGRSFYSSGREDVAFLTLDFPGGTLAQLHLSWLAPTRLRRTTISGTRRMVVYEDTAGPEAVKVYDHGIDVRAPESFGEAQLTYRTGDVHVPHLRNAEPLRVQWDHFLACVATGAPPRSDARQGLDTVCVLEAAERALRSGAREAVDYRSGAVAPAVLEGSRRG